MKHDKYIFDGTVVRCINATVRIELDRKRVPDVPIVTYARETQNIYQENGDVRDEVGRRKVGRIFTKRKPERIKFPFRHFCLT